MAEIPLAWKLQIQGAEDVKSRLSEINGQFQRGEISATEYSKSLREVNRDARTLNNTTRLQTSLYLAQHPAINNLSRSLSTLSSVSRTVLSISTAVNTMFIQQNTFATSLATKQHEYNDAMRDYALAVRDFGKDSVQAADALERISIASAEIKELEMQKVWSDWNTALVTISTAIISIKSGMDILVKIGPKLAGVLGSFAEIAGTIALSVSSFGAMFVALPAAMALLAAPIADFLVSLFGLEEWRNNNGKLFEEFFTQQIPMALGAAGEFLANFFFNDLPNWATSGFTIFSAIFTEGWNGIIKISEGAINTMIGGLEGLINAFISVINGMISAYNRVAKKLKLPTLSTIGAVSFPRITLPTIAAANGFDGMVNSPTMFLAGEAGAEHVSITPSGKKGASGTTIIVNVSGSIVSERELYQKIDENLKRELRRRNYRLLQ